MKIADVILLGLVVFWLVGVILYMGKKKKSGKCFGCSGCDGGNCSSCQKKENSI